MNVKLTHTCKHTDTKHLVVGKQSEIARICDADEKQEKDAADQHIRLNYNY